MLVQEQIGRAYGIIVTFFFQCICQAAVSQPCDQCTVFGKYFPFSGKHLSQGCTVCCPQFYFNGLNFGGPKYCCSKTLKPEVFYFILQCCLGISQKPQMRGQPFFFKKNHFVGMIVITA